MIIDIDSDFQYYPKKLPDSPGGWMRFFVTRPGSLLALLAIAPLGLAVSCGGDGTSASGGSGGATSSTSASNTGGGGGTPLPTGLTAKVTSTRFLTADHMLASIEMQISGEPFAELLGRDLGGYDRFSD